MTKLKTWYSLPSLLNRIIKDPSRADLVKELLDALNVLKPSEPDKITGLMPCGESKSVMWCTPGEGFWVASGKIGQLNGFRTEEMAKEAWNTSMGYKEETK